MQIRKQLRALSRLSVLPVRGNSSQLPYEKGSDRANRRMSYIIATKAWRSIGEYISILLPGFFVFMCVLS